MKQNDYNWILFDNKPRWPVKYQEQLFYDRSFLLDYFFRKRINKFDTKLFLHSRYYYIRMALETKFKRNFTPKEIYEIIKDKSWQK